MPLDRMNANYELSCDFVVCLSGREKFENLYFAASQAIWPLSTAPLVPVRRLRTLACQALGFSHEIDEDARCRASVHYVPGHADVRLHLAARPCAHLDPGQAKQRQGGLQARLPAPRDFESVERGFFSRAELTTHLVHGGRGENRHRGLSARAKTVLSRQASGSLQVAVAGRGVTSAQRDRRQATQRPQSGQVVGWLVRRFDDFAEYPSGFPVSAEPVETGTEARKCHDPPPRRSARLQLYCPSAGGFGSCEIAEHVGRACSQDASS